MSARHAAKKQFEQQMFAGAQRHIGVWPQGVVDATRERPDLVVRHTNGIYGVEVTEIVMSPRRALESARDDVCRKARARLAKQGIWLRVQIFFCDDRPGPEERRNDIAEALACFLRIAAATPDMQRGMHLVPEPADGLPAIRAIDARAVAEPADAHWDSGVRSCNIAMLVCKT